jgi:endonuclease-3
VNEVTKELFKKYRTLDDYVDADPEEFQKDIKSTGFYRNKTKSILQAAKIVKEQHGGKLPDTMDELTKVPGVGRKTANVILGNAYGIVDGIAVDTHVKRFAQKFDLTDHDDPKNIEYDLMALMPKEEWFYFTYRMIEYGRHICPARKHDCAEHPLTKIYPKAADIWPKAK